MEGNMDTPKEAQFRAEFAALFQVEGVQEEQDRRFIAWLRQNGPDRDADIIEEELEKALL